MENMKLPSFDAEASLAKASRSYSYALAGVATAEIGVLPSSIVPSQFDSVGEADDMGEDFDDGMEE